MNKKLLIRVIVVFGIAAAIFFLGGALAVLAVAVWIYLVFVVWKKKISLFRDQMEPKLAERHFKMLKVLLLIAGISLAAGIVYFIVQVGIFGPPEPEEEASVLVIVFISYGVFLIATIGGLFMFLKLRPDVTARLKELVSLRS